MRIQQDEQQRRADESEPGQEFQNSYPAELAYQPDQDKASERDVNLLDGIVESRGGIQFGEKRG